MPQPVDPLAAQGPDTREMVQLLAEAIRRHRVRVVFTSLVFVLIGLGLSMLWPSKFESETQFVLREARIITDAELLAASEDIPMAKKLLALDNELRSQNRVGAVLDELQWKEWLETAGRPSRRRELYLKIKDNLEVTMTQDVSAAINTTIAFQWTSAAKAADMVNRLRDSWIKLVLEGHRRALEGRKERAEKLLSERQQDFRDKLEALRTYQQEFNVPGLLSIELNNELKAEIQPKLLEAQARLASTVTEMELLRNELDVLMPALEGKLFASTPEQQAALVAVQAAEAKLAEVDAKYQPSHRLHKAAAADVATAHQMLEDAGGLPTDVLASSPNPNFIERAKVLADKAEEERELRSLVGTYEVELNAIDERLRRLPEVSMDLDRLNADKDGASELLRLALVEIQPLRDQVAAMRNANTAVNPTGGVVGTGAFEIIDVGLEPERPVLPMGAILLALAVLLGLAVGLTGPVLSELTRSSFGSVKEVHRVLGVPVLGAVDMILTARDLRARAIQSALSITTMVLVLAALATALYIYSFHPNVLPASVLRALREFQLVLT